MATDLELDELVRGVSKKYLSGFRTRVENLLTSAVKADRNPFNDAATATSAQSSALNTGQVCAYAGLNAPTGFLECNGAEVSSAQYPALAAILGTRFGSASAGKFRLPNATEAAIMGAGGTRIAGVATAAGSRFEGNTTSLTIAHLPEHRHDIDAISEENPGHVHDVTAYPNFGIQVPGNFKRGGSVSGGSGASFGEEMQAGPDYEDGASGHYGSDAAWDNTRDVWTRDERGDGPSSGPSQPGEVPASQRQYTTVLFGPNAGALQPTEVTPLDVLKATAFAIGAPVAGVIAAPGLVATAISGAGGGLIIGATTRNPFYNKDGTRNTNAGSTTPSTGGQLPGQIGGGGSPAPPPFNPTITNPTQQPTTTPTPTYVFVGGGTQQTNVNQINYGNLPDAPSIPSAPARPDPAGPGRAPGAPSTGTNPDDTNRPGSTPTTPGPTGPGSRPRNTGPGSGSNTTTAPAEDKSTAPPVATRENPFDTTLFNESQREEFNESIETFYEDYATRLGQGAAAWNIFIDSNQGRAGISYGEVDANATTGESGAHTHTTSGQLGTTGGSGLMGVQQPSFALMWIIRT